MNAAEVIDRFHNVKPVGSDRYVAGCPICQSKRGRPIAIRETADAKVLLHAFCGCEIGAVLGAVGLTLSDLFPKRIGAAGVERRPFDAWQVLQAVAHELLVACIIIEDAKAGNTLDTERLALASSRLQAALDVVDPKALRSKSALKDAAAEVALKHSKAAE